MQDDLRDATRMLRSQPGFAAAALLILLGTAALIASYLPAQGHVSDPDGDYEGRVG